MGEASPELPQARLKAGVDQERPADSRMFAIGLLESGILSLHRLFNNWPKYRRLS